MDVPWSQQAAKTSDHGKAAPIKLIAMDKRRNLTVAASWFGISILVAHLIRKSEFNTINETARSICVLQDRSNVCEGQAEKVAMSERRETIRVASKSENRAN